MIEPFFKNIRYEIIKELNSATKEIKVAVCWFTSQELFDVLCEKLSNNISVTLIILNDAINNSPNGLDFQKFINIGGKFFFGDIETPMHNKYCIIDGEVLINGSYNWTFFAEKKNNENITVIRDKQVAVKFIDDFTRLMKECKGVSVVKEEANTNSQQITIIENARIASDTDIIIKNKKDFDGTELILKNSIGEKLHDDKFFVFIPKNSKLPVSRSHTLTTVNDNQVECNTDIRYGESSTGSLNQQIGSFVVKEIPPLTKGKPELITTFSIDSYGILTVIVKVRETGRIAIHKFNVENLVSSK